MKELNTIADYRIVGILSDPKQTEKTVYQSFLVEFVHSGGLHKLAVSASGDDCAYMATHIGDTILGVIDIYSYHGRGQYEGRLFTNVRFKILPQ